MQLSLSKILTGIALGLLINGVALPETIAAETKEITTKEVKENTSSELKETPSKEVKESNYKNIKETPSKEVKKTSTKEGYTTKAETNEPDLFEVGDLPKSIVNSIIVTSFVITVIGVLAGTGKSIKYDKESEN